MTVYDKIAKRVFAWRKSPEPFGPWQGGDRYPIECYGLVWNKRNKRWYIWWKRGSSLAQVIAYDEQAQKVFQRVMTIVQGPEWLWLVPYQGQRVVISNVGGTKGHCVIMHPSGNGRWVPLENYKTLDDLRAVEDAWPNGPKFSAFWRSKHEHNPTP